LGRQNGDVQYADRAVFFQAEDGIRDGHVTGVQTCALPISTALAKALESNPPVTSLSLQHNQIGTTGATALAKALELNSSLTSLRSEERRVGKDGRHRRQPVL